MRSKVKNKRLYKALMACALATEAGYSDVVKIVAARAKYKSHRKVYDLVARRGGVSAPKMFQIVDALNDLAKPEKPYTVDYLFGEA